MNCALALEQNGLILDRDGTLAFLSSRSTKSARELSSSAGEVLTGMTAVLEQILTGMIETRTAAEFEASFKDAFPKYAAVVLALSSFVDAAVPSQIVERLRQESFCEMEAEFRDKALAAFGAEVRDQALFTVWTLRKISDLLRQIHAVPKVDASQRVLDKEFARKFTVSALVAHFGLDCLTTALQAGSPVYPGVLETITDHLRSAVNAYAWARKGADLRNPNAEPKIEVVEWDDEEQQLLREATFDMLPEPLD